MPKVSVIIPIYNVEKYLRECLDSVVNQTLRDIEIICVNDGSTDGSIDIIQEYAQKDNRIKVVNKKNSGYGDSMNKGLEAVTGEYIGIIESDDIAELNMFEDLYNLAKDNNADLVKSDFYEYYSAKNLNKKRDVCAEFKENLFSSIFDCPNVLSIQPSIWSAIYRTKLIRDNEIRFLTTPGASYQDTSFAFKTTALAKNIVLTNNAYVHYRQDNEASSINSKGKVFIITEEYDEIDKFIKENNLKGTVVETVKLINQYNAYCWNLGRIGKSFKKDFVKVFSEAFKRYYDGGDIQEEFFGYVKRKKIDLLINNPEKFLFKYNYNKFMGKIKKLQYNIFRFRYSKNEKFLYLFGKCIWRGE